LRHCATIRKAAGSIPDGVNHKIYFLEDKDGRCVGLTTLTPTWADSLKSVILNLLEPSEPVQAPTGIALPLILYSKLREGNYIGVNVVVSV